MGSRPIRIVTEVDTSGFSGFEVGASASVSAAENLARAFSGASSSARALSTQTVEATKAFTSLSPAVAEQAAVVLNLKTALASVSSSLRETEQMIVQAGGASEVGASLVEQYSAEIAAQSLIQKQLTAATAEYKAVLEESFASSQKAAAAAAEQAAADDAMASSLWEAVMAANANAEAQASAAEAQETQATASADQATASDTVATSSASAVTAQEAQANASQEQAVAADAAAEAMEAEATAAVPDAFMRVAAATIANTRAQQELRSATQAATQTVGAESETTQALAESMQRARAASMELAAAQAALKSELGGTAAAATGASRSFYSMGSMAAYGAGRIAASEAGLGSLGYVLGRVAMSAGALSTVFQYAFPVLLVVAMIEPLERLFDWLDKDASAAANLDMKMNQITTSAAETANSIEMENLKLQDQIDKLERVPSPNGIREAALEDEQEIESLSEKLGELLEKEQKTFNPSGLDKFTNFLKHMGSDLVYDLSLFVKPGSTAFGGDSYKTAIDVMDAEAKKLAQDQGGIIAIQAEMSEGTMKQSDGLQAQLRIWENIKSDMESMQKNDLLDPDQLMAVNQQLVQASEAIRAIKEEEKTPALRQKETQAQKDAEAYKNGLEAFNEMIAAQKAANEYMASAQKRGAEDAEKHQAEAVKQNTEAIKSMNEAMHISISEGEEWMHIFYESKEPMFANAAAGMKQIMAGMPQFKLQPLGLGQQILQSFQAIIPSMKASIEDLSGYFNRGFAEWIRGSTTFTRAMRKQFLDMVGDVLVGIEKWIMKEIVLGITHELTAMKMQVSTAASTASTVAATKTQQVAYAGQAAAAAGASVAGIPFVGPELATAVAAQTFATLAAFAKGGIVPGSGSEGVPVLAHPKEMILPAHISAFINNMASASDQVKGSGPGDHTPAGDMHFHFSPTVSAIDSSGVSAMLNKHRDLFASTVMKALRDRNMS